MREGGRREDDMEGESEGEKERSWKNRHGRRAMSFPYQAFTLPPSLSLPPSIRPLPFRYHQVMKAIWSALDQPGRNWRSVFKSLTLLDHLVKNGAERVVEDVSDTVFM